MDSLSGGLGFAQCPELGQCVIVPAVVLVQWKGGTAKWEQEGGWDSRSSFLDGLMLLWNSTHR